MPSVPRLLKRPGALLSKFSLNSGHRASSRLLRASNKPWVASLLQRLPIISHLSLALLVVLGPTHAPYLLAAVFLLTHVIFAATQVRLGFGMLWYVISLLSFPFLSLPFLSFLSFPLLSPLSLLSPLFSCQPTNYRSLHNPFPIAAISTHELIPKPTGGLFSSAHHVMTMMSTTTRP